MKAILAELIAKRFESFVFESESQKDTKNKCYLVRKIYPLISQSAHKGLTTTSIEGIIPDEVRKILINDGYVVRHERGQAYTSIEWGMQTVMDEEGNPRYVTAGMYNNIRKDYIDGKSLDKYNLDIVYPFPIE